jgi:AcrR family transcriptional regulator
VTTPRSQSRRTQSERSASTRARILEATVSSLYEFGYHRTTTQRIEQRAGVTRGALLHHFGAKSVLLAETVRYLVAKWEAQLEQAREANPPLKPRHLLNEFVFRRLDDPLFCAYLEIWIAARTDIELLAVLRPLHRELGERLKSLAAQVFGRTGDDSEFVSSLEVAAAFAHGAALAEILEPPSKEEPSLEDRWLQTGSLASIGWPDDLH